MFCDFVTLFFKKYYKKYIIYIERSLKNRVTNSHWHLDTVKTLIYQAFSDLAVCDSVTLCKVTKYITDRR